jgi:hypothetical protein
VTHVSPSLRSTPRHARRRRAQKDSVTPLLATLVSAVVNVAGDALLVVKLRLGVPGAAAATAFAAWAGTATLLGAARRELVPRGGFFGRGGKGGGGEGADGEAEYKIPVSKVLRRDT